jgi:hypothetical protein
MKKPESVEVNLNLGILQVKGTWVPNERERSAAWEMYVELITRVSVEKLHDGEGILREALESLYSIFDSTRTILKKYGTDIAKARKNKHEYSFGHLSILILNRVLRPFLTKWHPILEEYESKRPVNMSIKEYEDKWALKSQMRSELEEVREILVKFSHYLAIIAGVPPLDEAIEENGTR